MKKIFAIVMSVLMIACFMPTMAFAEDSSVVLPEGVTADTFTNGTTVYYNGDYYTSINDAIAKAKTDHADANDTAVAEIYCKPDATVNIKGNNTEDHIGLTTSITIYGNGATLNAGWEPDIGVYFTQTENVNIEINNLGKAGIWGFKNSEYDLTVSFEDCKDVHEVLLQYTSGNGRAYTTVRNCTFKGSAAGGTCGNVGVQQDFGGTLLVENCTFEKTVCGVNCKNDEGDLAVTIRGCTFTDCSVSSITGADNQTYAAPIRRGAKTNASGSVAISGCSFVYTTDAAPVLGTDIIIGENRTGNNGAGTVTANISSTAAKVKVFAPHGSSVASVANEEKTLTAEDTLAINNAAVGAVAKIENDETTNYYDTLANAVNAATEGQTITLLDNVALSQELVVGRAVTIKGDNHKIIASENINDHLVEITASATLKNVTLESASKAKGVNVYANTNDLNVVFEDVEMLKSSGNGLTVKGGTATLKNVEISGSAWTQSIDISDSANPEVKGGNLIIDKSTSLKDDLQIIFDFPSTDISGETGTITASGWNVTSKDKEITKADGNKYTKRIFTLSEPRRSSSSSSSTTTTTDNVTNKAEDKGADTSTSAGTTTVATTTATVKTETKTATDGTKTVAATVDTTTASKIVEKAVGNKSEEVVVNTASAATVAETAAGTKTEVALPEQTVKAIAKETEAAVTIKSDAAEVKLDTEAVKAVADQAGDLGTVSLVVETVAQSESKVEVDLKLVTSKGTVSDFKGGSVSVTVKLNTALAAKPVVCVYIDDFGTYHKVKGAKNADGTFTFETGHFSTYAVMPEDEADGVIAEQTAKVNEMVGALSLKARSEKTEKGSIKVTLTADEDAIKAIEDLGYTVKYKFYRSTKKSASYKAALEKADKTYTNTTGKKGTKYYYKARVMVYDAQGELVTKTELKQCRYACRTK